MTSPSFFFYLSLPTLFYLSSQLPSIPPIIAIELSPFSPLPLYPILISSLVLLHQFLSHFFLSPCSPPTFLLCYLLPFPHPMLSIILHLVKFHPYLKILVLNLLHFSLRFPHTPIFNLLTDFPISITNMQLFLYSACLDISLLPFSCFSLNGVLDSFLFYSIASSCYLYSYSITSISL